MCVNRVEIELKRIGDVTSNDCITDDSDELEDKLNECEKGNGLTKTGSRGPSKPKQIYTSKPRMLLNPGDL